jgi:hypothetical protein
MTDESKKSVAAVLAVVAGFATLLVLQKAFKLTGSSFIGWAIPCIFVGVATYNLLKPSESSRS